MSNSELEDLKSQLKFAEDERDKFKDHAQKLDVSTHTFLT